MNIRALAMNIVALAMNIVALAMSTGNEHWQRTVSISLQLEAYTKTSSAYVTYRFFNCIPEPIKYTKSYISTSLSYLHWLLIDIHTILTR